MDIVGHWSHVTIEQVMSHWFFFTIKVVVCGHESLVWSLTALGLHITAIIKINRYRKVFGIN